MRNDPIETALERLDDVRTETPQGLADVGKALSSKWNLVAAKASRKVSDRHCLDLFPQLTAAFDRFLKSGASLDKGCAATLAIARTLVTLDHDNAELFRRGIKHVQMEATWGGKQDTAAELRAVCAMGLANSSDARKLRDLVELLVDPEWPARAGAVRAITVLGSDAAALVLRYKALLGDSEPEVLSDALIGLLGIEGSEAMPLAIALARSDDAPTREAAILAMGESRRADAIEYLARTFGEVADPDTKKCILLALSTSRTEAAIDVLLKLIRTGSRSTAAMALKAIEIHRADPKIQAMVEEAEAASLRT